MSKTATRDRQTARRDRAARVQASIAAAVNCPLCPEITAEVGLDVLTKTLESQAGRPWWNCKKKVLDRAARLTDDPAWRECALGWIEDYRAAHGHGPRWRRFWAEPSLWPADTNAALLNTVMRQLNKAGYLDGTKTPFGLCERSRNG